MKFKVPYISILLLIIVVAVMHIAGIYFKLYWRLDWYDTVVHFLGAFWIALSALSLLTLYSKKISPTTFFILGIGITIVVGILWELFEHKAGVTSPLDREFFPDMIGDLIIDIMGGMCGSWYVVQKIKIISAWNQQK